MKNALITGITGQDGSYLAELLLDNGYEVHGLRRRASSFNTDRIDHLYQEPHDRGPRFFLHYADRNDASSLTMALSRICPDEIYNFSLLIFDMPLSARDVQKTRHGRSLVLPD